MQALKKSSTQENRTIGRGRSGLIYYQQCKAPTKPSVLRSRYTTPGKTIGVYESVFQASQPAKEAVLVQKNSLNV